MKGNLMFLLICLILCAVAVPASADSIFTKHKNISEAGILIGKPAGITGKYFLTDIDAFDADLGFGPDFMAHFDYLRHDFAALKVSEGEMPFYYGAGLLFGKSIFCVQVKAGMEYYFDTNPLGIFIEAAPAFGSDFILQGGVGVRYRIK